MHKSKVSLKLKDFLKKVNRGTGKREMLLDSGDRYKVIAATRKARGLSSDLIMMDELREQTTWDAWGAVSKTMMARPSAILFGFSNAGDVSSVVLRHLRAQAHAALGDPDGIAKSREALGGDEVESLGVFEWSAVPGCDLNDREQWAQANPSLGYGFMTEIALKSAAATDPERVFRTECLCQWVESILPPPSRMAHGRTGLIHPPPSPANRICFSGLICHRIGAGRPSGSAVSGKMDIGMLRLSLAGSVQNGRLNGSGNGRTGVP